MYIILSFFIGYLVAAFVLYRKNKTKYEYRSSNNLEKLVDFLLIPFMEIIATGKDSHWWDYEFFDEKLIPPNIQLLKVDSGKPQSRLYKRSKFFGQYNLSGASDLYKTLRILKNVVVIEPINYTGKWSLVIKGHHRFEDNKETFILCKFMTSGRVQNLIDGKKSYMGMSDDGKLLELKQVEICNRNKHRDILFV